MKKKKNLRDWFNDLVIHWMFGGQRCKKEDRITEVSGRDDENCIFAETYIVTWNIKGKKPA